MLKHIGAWLEQQINRWQPLEANYEPAFGAVIYTDILFGLAEHSGIYVGEHQVVSLQHNGRIIQSNIASFAQQSTTLKGDIYLPCEPMIDWPIASYESGKRALDMIGKHRKYNLILDNCHIFSAGCVTGDFENTNSFLWMLKDEVRKYYLEPIIWKKWKWRG